MKNEPEKLIKKHPKLVHSDMMQVTSHVQRKEKDSEWVINTIMVKGYDVPFKYKRKKLYKDITGQCVNLTYYPKTEIVAGLEFEIMNVVRIRIA
jgi:hypothetical protein